MIVHSIPLDNGSYEYEEDYCSNKHYCYGHIYSGDELNELIDENERIRILFKRKGTQWINQTIANVDVNR